jgi:hypothetical protein
MAVFGWKRLDFDRFRLDFTRKVGVKMKNPAKILILKNFP